MNNRSSTFLEKFIDEVSDLCGVLQIAALDLDGSVLAVDLVDLTGKKYLIVDNPKGEALLRQVGKTISVTGRVTYEAFGRLLEVEKYRER